MHSMVWSGSEVLMWGGTDKRFGGGMVFPDGAAYDPATGNWRPIPPAPIGGRVAHEAVWEGREMVVWGGDSRCCWIHGAPDVAEAAAYDPVADRWRRLADVPKPWSNQGGATTLVHEGQIYLSWFGHIGVYDRDRDRWSEIGKAPPGPPPGPIGCSTSGGPSTAAVAAGNDVFTWNGDVYCESLFGTALRLGDRSWREVAPVDLDWVWMLVPDGTGHIYGGLGEDGCVSRYDIADDHWSPLPPPEGGKRIAPFSAWTAEGLLIWGGWMAGSPAVDGAILDPKAAENSELAAGPNLCLVKPVTTPPLPHQ